MIEEGDSRDHAFGLVTKDRAYHLTAENYEEKRQWVEVIRYVRSLPEHKVQSLLVQEVDPKNAAMTIDLDSIDSVQAEDQELRPNSFVVITANRVYNFKADSLDIMHMWIGALSPRKYTVGDEDVTVNCIMKGWLVKEGKVKRRRYFVLTEKGQLHCYRTEDTRQPLVGNIHLNCLCAVDTFSEEEAMKGAYTIKLHTRKTTYRLNASSAEGVSEWISALQDAIDSCPPIQTVTERLILEIIRQCRNPHWDVVYEKHKILCRMEVPIKYPLLALPYGKPNLSEEKDMVYSTRQAEAVKIFNALLSQECIADPIKVVQTILTKCYDIVDLQSEAFCQLIKQTAGLTQQDVDSPNVLSCWQMLGSMCCSFVPERTVKKYLVMHLNNIQAKFRDTEMAKFATFCQECLQRTKQRDFVPSRNEVIACLGRRDLKTTLYCYGDGQCNIVINSATTAGEVVQKLCLGLQITGENNKFALFENNGDVFKVIDDRVVLADVLGKFDMHQKPNEKWKLFFKLFCYFKPRSVPNDSIEASFIFEQSCDDVVSGRFPAAHETLLKLAALRIQFLDGDIESVGAIEDIGELYPMSRIEREAKDKKDQYAIGNQHETYYMKTLRGSKGVGTLSKHMRAPEITEDDRIKAASAFEANVVKAAIMDYWRKLNGVSASFAQQKYMEILSQCPAFGSTFFEVEYPSKDQRFPKDLWLAINCRGIQIYQRSAVAPIQTNAYESIVSFGAPSPNEYRLVIEGQAPVALKTTQVAEIGKLIKVYISYVVSERGNNKVS